MNCVRRDFYPANCPFWSQTPQTEGKWHSIQIQAAAKQTESSIEFSIGIPIEIPIQLKDSLLENIPYCIFRFNGLVFYCALKANY